MFKPIDNKKKLSELEREVLSFWKENKVFEKSVEKNSESKSFIFYEGPPTANGKPGLHHVLARAFKDIIPRYKTMRGFHVERKAGWDTHGLPVEIQVEKQLGIKQKQEIENIVPGDSRQSIVEFNKKCKESVWQYKDEWEKLTERMAYWVDMDNPYITYENKYIESVWWVIAQVAKLKDTKGESLLYKGHKVVPYCYRCGTALSSHEVAQEYQIVKDNSVYVKFKLKPNLEKGIDDNIFVLAWTTTPWTLPGNVALAVAEDISYVNIEHGDSKYILAKDQLHNVFKKGFGESYSHDGAELKFIKGKNLIGLEYESLYKISNDKNAYKIVGADFVSAEEGTGIVHIAPAFGEDDAKAGQENNLLTLVTVDEEGKINVDVPGKGIPVKKKNDKNRYIVDDLIIGDLKERGLLFAEEVCEHEYPFCWRCDTPLIYYAKPSWFIRMSELADDLVKNNEEINWVPDYIKDGRFGDWLKNVKDWAISRDRYWGTPVPIWQCEKCGNIKVTESIKELEELSGQKLDDLHKPFIDDVKIKCSCGEEMKRTPEVLDVWFDSGSMPLAQFFYPNSVDENTKEKIEKGKYFPADYISEAIDQTRGWFYTLHAIATLLKKAGRVKEGYAYKNVICLAHILDVKGKKMSKSRGNVIDPMETMEKYGADSLRWVLFTINQPGMPKRFDIKAMKDVISRVFRMILNSYSFFVTYANVDNWISKIRNPKSKIQNLLDKWIISELNSLIKNVTEKIDHYDIYNAAKIIEKFIDNLSNWYIRRSRRRFWKSEDDSDKNSAYQTLYTVLLELSKLMAPFTPFISEMIYRNLAVSSVALAKEDETISVHLEDYPAADKSLIDEKLNDQMEKVRKIVEMGLAARAKARIKVRQPLNELLADGVNELPKELIDLIIDEVNVKKLRITNYELRDSLVEITDNDIKIAIDTEITEDLQVEGIAREIVRMIQQERKNVGFDVSDRILVSWFSEDEFIKKAFSDFRDYIMREVLAEKMDNNLKDGIEIKTEDRSWQLAIKKK